jgi:chromosome segregation protein
MEILGFKSFADKTVIDFEPGITAVVGPNGSGKSNITEALRWVLGEQSAKNLRGGKMFDIIFAGSNSRKALNVAEVTIVLDNEDGYLPLDFQEVSLTRRLLRAGESDIYINKKTCRLKDIVDLLMDSGLGKESFSIISQGKVEAIFQSKPEERRGIFEEAAGILKYKTRKRQAEQKLVDTEENLSRLQDIIYELEEQLTPLAKQKKTAEEFISLREQLTQVDISLTVYQIQENKELWESNKEFLKQAKDTLNLKQDEVVKLESKLQMLRDKRNLLDTELETINKDLLTIIKEEKSAEGKCNLLLERSLNSEKNAEDLRQSITDTEKELTQAKRNVEEVAEELAKKNQQVKCLEEELLEVSELVSSLSLSVKEQLDQLRSKYLIAHEEEIQTKSKLEHLEIKYAQETEKNQQTIERFKALNQQIEAEKQKLAKEKKEFSLIQNELQSQLNEYAKQAEEIKNAEENIHTSESKWQQMLSVLQTKQARFKSLCEIEESYQGYFHGVKAILQQRESLEGIVGTIAELLTLKPSYHLAVETALGQMMQNIVVEDEESGRRAVQFLKKKRVGRATFLPLTTIRARLINENHRRVLEGFPGFIGIVSELVECSAKVKPIIQNILGKTLLAKDLKSANDLARKMNFQYRVVSLEGDVMNAGGSMTGGANKHGSRSPLFAGKQELQALTKEIAVLEKECQMLEAAFNAAKDQAQTSQAQLENLRETGEKIRIQKNNQQHLLQNIQTQLEHLQKERGKLKEEAQDVEEFLQRYQEQKLKLTQKIQEADEAAQEMQKHMQQVEEKKETQESKRVQAQAKEQEKKEALAVISEQIRSLEKTLQEKSERVSVLSNSLTEFSTNLENLSKTSSEQTIDQEMLTTRLAELVEKREFLANSEKEKRKARSEIVEQLARDEIIFADQNKEVQEIQEKFSAIELVLDRAGNKLDNLLEYLQEEYSKTFEHAMSVSIEIEDIGQAKANVSRLKREMDALGSVNMAAIEQHQQVSKRFAFLQTQQEDLLKAKTSLHETMKEMDEEVKTRFSETFEVIKERFSKTFPSMFGGGKAELILTQPEDLLNTGVEIIAQPPGKKLQSLSLLSGGERALTALALLFAIIEVRPVPFAVLDEVEAALDEANVVRFAQYLSHFEKEMQFIVVTHRKGTMEAANVLYGITMQGSGVSKMVSVRLEDVAEGGKLKAKV